jgi:hypothetical protein
MRIDYLFFGAIGFFLMLSIMTADFHDPTIFNQLYPFDGISNWTGLIGALIGGTLLEVFGPSSLLLPWLFVRIILHYPRRISGFFGTYYALVIVFVLSIVHEISIKTEILNSVDLYFWQNGYAGKLAVAWMETSINTELSITFIAAMLILSVFRMYHVLSPLPFISGIFTILYKLLIFLAGKLNPPTAYDFPSNTQLPDLKGRLRLDENPAA